MSTYCCADPKGLLYPVGLSKTKFYCTRSGTVIFLADLNKKVQVTYIAVGLLSLEFSTSSELCRRS